MRKVQHSGWLKSYIFQKDRHKKNCQVCTLMQDVRSMQISTYEHAYTIYLYLKNQTNHNDLIVLILSEHRPDTSL